MRRALLLSSILPPLAVAGASILLRHHIERSVPLEGAHRHPFPPQHLPLQPPLSPPVGRCACLCSLLTPFSFAAGHRFGSVDTLFHRVLQTLPWSLRVLSHLSIWRVVSQRECCGCVFLWLLRGTIRHCFGTGGRIFWVNVTILRLIFVIYIFV